MLDIKTLFYKANFWGKKHSPEILVVSGILSAAASVGLAIYSTTKLNSVLNPISKKIDTIKLQLKDDNAIQNKEVDVKESRKALALEYAHAAGKVIALYTPSILFFGASIGCILGSHHIMKSRNLALAAACTTLEHSYKNYRERVKEKLGEEAEEKIYKDIRDEKVEIVDPKTGKTKVKKIGVPHTSMDGNEWNIMYDCGNTNWERDARLNWDFLMGAQDYLTTKLKRQGYLFLSDVWDYLGVTTAQIGEEKMRASHILGWIYEPTNPKRDNEIRFGLTEKGTRHPLPKIKEQIAMNFPAFWLDLNVDGDILSGEYGKDVFSRFARDGGCEAAGQK